MSTKRIQDNLSSNIVVIGGPSGNDTTAALLRTYCPGFKIHNSGDFSRMFYECGGHRFDDGRSSTSAFIVKLGPTRTNLTGAVMLLWGHYGVGTAAAAYFLNQHSKRLKKLGDGDSYFAAISLNGNLGYRSVSTSVLDISDGAFSD